MRIAARVAPVLSALKALERIGMDVKFCGDNGLGKIIVLAAALVSMAFFPGCDVSSGFGEADGPCLFEPVRVHIVGITSVVDDAENPNISNISTYVSLHDSFNSSLKVPGIFRFELYEYVPRSAQPKGRRIAAWDDYDLNGPQKNNNYWNDFLRAYHFELDGGPSSFKTGSYVLQVTCMTPAGKRLTDIFELGAR